MMGRRAVVICSTTSTKIKVHVKMPADERTRECEKPAWRKRNPKIVAMNRNVRCRTPIHIVELVDWEKSHATGAKPMSKSVISISSPAVSPLISESFACDPLRQVKM